MGARVQRYNARKAEDEPYVIENPTCYKCRCTLAPAGFVVVCENGHIDDFPWAAWAHAKSRNPRPICGTPNLLFKTGSSLTEGLQGLVVECLSCGATATFKDAFKPLVFKTLVEDGYTEFACKGRHPWRGTRCACDKTPLTKQRGDSSVYYSNTVSSIVIPSSSDVNTNKVSECSEYKKILDRLEDCDDDEERAEQIQRKEQKWAEKIARDLLLESDQVLKILRKLLLKSEDKKSPQYSASDMEYRIDEYEALEGKIPNIRGSKDFFREDTNIEDYNIPALKQIVLVKRLREIRALIGFSRINPKSPEQDGFVDIKQPEDDWYPGYEVRGEGIFIKLDQDILDRWSNTDFAIKRELMMRDNFSRSRYGLRGNIEVSSQYVLLHTLSHLLIKELSFESGYNVASLQERLYYQPKTQESEGMAGILIYTAGGDSEGTLGGLVRQGRTDCFPRIFKRSIDNARMCSNDPVCITSAGQGRESQNLAACHSCCLIPETSCEQFNIGLDRALLVGTFEEPNGGLYSDWESAFVFTEKGNTEATSQESADNWDIGSDGAPLTGTYEEIWEYLEQDTEDVSEKEFLEKAAELSTERYEKPIYNGSLVDKNTGEKVTVDFIWRDSKVLFWLIENYEEYCKVKNSNWKCFCLKEGQIDPQVLLNKIRI